MTKICWKVPHEKSNKKYFFLQVEDFYLTEEKHME
jgi:hypothetical protein